MSTSKKIGQAAQILAARDDDQQEAPPKPRGLYAISRELDLVTSMMASDGYDETLVNAALDGWLEANAEELTAKLDDYCAVIAEQSALAKTTREEMRELAKLAQSREGVADKLKERIKTLFTKLGMTKMETKRFRPQLRPNGGVTPVVFSDRVMGETNGVLWLPEEFVITTYAPDTDKIRKALEDGAEIADAKLGDRGNHVRIR